MTKYFFHIEAGGNALVDQTGLSLPDDCAAGAYAKRVAKEIAEDATTDVVVTATDLSGAETIRVIEHPRNGPEFRSSSRASVIANEHPFH